MLQKQHICDEKLYQVLPVKAQDFHQQQQKDFGSQDGFDFSTQTLKANEPFALRVWVRISHVHIT